MPKQADGPLPNGHDDMIECSLLKRDIHWDKPGSEVGDDVLHLQNKRASRGIKLACTADRASKIQKRKHLTGK